MLTDIAVKAEDCLGWSSIFYHFQIYFNKLGYKVCILLFSSCVKFHAKICMYYWNINRSHGGEYFLCSPCSTVSLVCTSAGLLVHSMYVGRMRRQHIVVLVIELVSRCPGDIWPKVTIPFLFYVRNLVSQVTQSKIGYSVCNFVNVQCESKSSPPP